MNNSETPAEWLEREFGELWDREGRTCITFTSAFDDSVEPDQPLVKIMYFYCTRWMGTGVRFRPHPYLRPIGDWTPGIVYTPSRIMMKIKVDDWS